MIELRARNAYNEKYAPNGAKKAYIARITGRNSSMTFEREFLGREVTIDEPGLFELRDTDKKGRPDDTYVVITRATPDADLEEFSVDKQTAMTIAKALDAKRDIEGIVDVSSGDLEIRTAKQEEKAAAATTVNEAVEECWLSFVNLDDKQRKQVLAGLKAKMNPLKPATPEATPVEEPAVTLESPEVQNSEVANRASWDNIPDHGNMDGSANTNAPAAAS